MNLDGSGLKLLTKGDYFHRVEVDDDARFVVDNYSRVNTVPCATLLDTNGNKVMDIQESDFSQLFAAGYKFPEIFKVKAADGVTDLYGYESEASPRLVGVKTLGEGGGPQP